MTCLTGAVDAHLLHPSAAAGIASLNPAAAAAMTTTTTQPSGAHPTKPAAWLFDQVFHGATPPPATASAPAAGLSQVWSGGQGREEGEEGKGGRGGEERGGGGGGDE